MVLQRSVIIIAKKIKERKNTATRANQKPFWKDACLYSVWLKWWCNDSQKMLHWKSKIMSQKWNWRSFIKYTSVIMYTTKNKQDWKSKDESEVNTNNITEVIVFNLLTYITHWQYASVMYKQALTCSLIPLLSNYSL